MTASQAVTRFRRLGILTILAVYAVILAGGVVRASGAGMGCPDWPTCFGQWVPPTSEAQLPANYHEIYTARGYESTIFNPVKTWTEYTNRLIGVTVGILIFLTAWSSRIYLKNDKIIFNLSIAVFFLVGFQGWLGSAVVASNLKPVMITMHMLVAMLIVALLIYAVTRSQKSLFETVDTAWVTLHFRRVLKLAMFMTLLQVAMGTQVRESVDILAHQQSAVDRQFWRESFPLIFYVHRSFSSLILLINLWLGWTLFRQLPAVSSPVQPLVAGNRLLRRFAFLLVFLVVAAIAAGISLDRLGFPMIAQPIHLLMANLIFGTQFFIFISLKLSSGNQGD